MGYRLAIFDQYIAVPVETMQAGTQLPWKANRNSYAFYTEWCSFLWNMAALYSISSIPSSSRSQCFQGFASRDPRSYFQLLLPHVISWITSGQRILTTGSITGTDFVHWKQCNVTPTSLEYCSRPPAIPLLFISFLRNLPQYDCQCFQWAGQPPKLPIGVGYLDPIWYMVSFFWH